MPFPLKSWQTLQRFCSLNIFLPNVFNWTELRPNNLFRCFEQDRKTKARTTKEHKGEGAEIGLSNLLSSEVTFLLHTDIHKAGNGAKMLTSRKQWCPHQGLSDSWRCLLLPRTAGKGEKRLNIYFQSFPTSQERLQHNQSLVIQG